METIEPTPWSRPFWDGVAADELRLPWCEACGQPHFPPRKFCPHCWDDDIVWRTAAGHGVVHTYSTVRSYPPRDFADRLPFVVAIIELEEGVRMFSNITGDGSDLAIGDRVQVEFRDAGGGQKLPIFTRTPSPQT